MISVTKGFDETERAQIALLYWGAFGEKLGRVMGPDQLALRFLNRVLDPSHALVARQDNQVLGVLGFKTYEGALVGGTFNDLRAVYGLLGAGWRAVLLSLLERDVENRRFLLDGVFVDPKARGRGVGTALLDAAFAEAEAQGFGEIRLDVIDSNPRARALYERLGFVAGEVHNLGFLKPVFRFQSSLTMIKRLRRAA